MAKLKPCPFCGGEAQLYKHETGTRDIPFGYQVVCKQCNASSTAEDREDFIVECWNTRAGESAVMQFAKKILHGDDEHRSWLLDAAEAFNKGASMPEVRGGASQAQPVSVPKVRRLKWEKEGEFGGWISDSEPCYSIIAFDENEYAWACGIISEMNYAHLDHAYHPVCESFSEAKDAAQIHYEKLILAGLEEVCF